MSSIAIPVEIVQIATKHLQNASDVLEALSASKLLPPFILKGGLVIHHRFGDPVGLMFHEIFVERAYTPDQFYRPQAGDVIFDAGANIGLFALYLVSLEPRINVHCFEPNPTVFNTLVENIQINHLTKIIHAYPFALSSISGRGWLYPGPASRAGDSLYQQSRATKLEGMAVQAITLDEAFAYTGAQRLSLLKLDIEGAEKAVFSRGKYEKTLQQSERATIEIHDFVQPGCRARCESTLRENNFHVTHRVFERDLKLDLHRHEMVYGTRF